MIILNTLKWLAVVVVALVLAAVLYLSFADLGWLKPRIESAVNTATGRQVQLGGAFDLDIVPSPAILLEDVRLSNAAWGSEPTMVNLGHLHARLGFWSLLSGPIRVKALQLRDLEILLEANEQGEGNWVMGAPGSPERVETPPAEESDTGSGAGRVPVIVESAELSNISLSYLAPGSEPFLAELASLEIRTDSAEYTLLEGNGVLAELPYELSGKVGPDRALATGEGIEIELSAGLDILALSVDGNVGDLEAATGIDIQAVASSDDLTRLLEFFEIDSPLTGPLNVKTALTSVEPGTRVAVDANAGDIAATATLTRVDGSLDVEVAVPALDRVGEALAIEGLPREDLSVYGRIVDGEDAYQLEDITARLAEAKLTLDGSVGKDSAAGAAFSFAASGPSLASLSTGLPEIPFKAGLQANIAPDRLMLDGIEATFGDSDLSGFLEVATGERTSVAGSFNSQRLNLTPFAAVGETAGEGAESAATVPPEPQQDEAERRYVFGDEPLALEQLNLMDVDVDARIDYLAVNNTVMLDVMTAVNVKNGELRVQNGFRGPAGGRSDSDVTLSGASEPPVLDVEVMMRDLRVNLISGDIDEPSLIPPLDITVDFRSAGTTPRALASSADGRILVTQGQGQLENDLIGTIGGGIFQQLFSALNPFAEEETTTTLDCTVFGLDIADGMGEIAGMLFQTEKIKAMGDGEIDLNTEELNIEFNTQPREGVGVSATMFVTPFVKLAGTLDSPTVGVNKKGTLLAGAAVAATGGLAILAKGAADRTAGGADSCQVLLDEIGGHPPLDG